MTHLVVVAVFVTGMIAVRARPPAPCGEGMYGAARIGVNSGAMLLRLGVVVGTPGGLLVGALSGFEATAALWVLRCPASPAGSDDDNGGGRGGNDGPRGPDRSDGPDGGRSIDWDAVELDAYNAWREHDARVVRGASG
jgi:hypothetical protein